MLFEEYFLWNCEQWNSKQYHKMSIHANITFISLFAILGILHWLNYSIKVSVESRPPIGYGFIDSFSSNVFILVINVLHNRLGGISTLSGTKWYPNVQTAVIARKYNGIHYGPSDGQTYNHIMEMYTLHVI